jgi:hypothetical protein
MWRKTLTAACRMTCPEFHEVTEAQGCPRANIVEETTQPVEKVGRFPGVPPAGGAG